MKKCRCLYIQEMDVTGLEVKGCKLSKSQFLQLVWAVQSGPAFNINPDSGERQVVFTTTPEINRQMKDVCAEVGLVLPIDKLNNKEQIVCKKASSLFTDARHCEGCNLSMTMEPVNIVMDAVFMKNAANAVVICFHGY